MSISKLNILINDTTGVVGTDVFKKTQRGNPHLNYNGGDTEFQPIVASQLSFNMLVETAEDAKFLHLFTGDETRYEVQLEDAETGTIYWQGYLLPDLYQEPYENGCFFIDFTATDGLGRLKNKYLSDTFYKDIKQIPQILGACLRLTGLNFNTIIAPAITNAAATITTKDIEIDTSNYIDNSKKKNAYEILEGLLTTMGCRLFQWQEKWYVIGINRTNDAKVYCEFYSPQGWSYVADGINYFTRPIKSIVFEATPNITAVPPFKTVEIDWKKNTTSNVLPEDVVYQLPLNQGFVDYTTRYWQAIGSGYNLSLTSKTFWTGVTDFFLWSRWYKDSPITSSRDPFYVTLTGEVTEANVEANYITLTEANYIKGSYSLENTINIEIEFVAYSYGSMPNDILDSYKQKILYEVVLDNEIILSNKPSFDVGQEFDFDIKTNEFDLSGVLKVDNVPVTKSGEINIKIHPIIEIPDTAGYSISRMVITKCNITYNSNNDTENIVKNRVIDFTTSTSVTVPFGGDRSNLTYNNIKVSDFVSYTPFDIVINAEDVVVPFEDYLHYSYLHPYTATTIWETILYLTEVNYNYLLKYIDYVYVKRAVTGTFEQLTDFLLYNNTTRGYILTQINAANPILEADELYVRIPAQTIRETNRNYLRAAWKRYQTTENIDYLEALARVYHSTIRDTKFKIEGNVFGLITPLDILQFNYLTAKNYNAVSLDLDLSEGQTKVTLVESVNKEITDYE